MQTSPAAAMPTTVKIGAMDYAVTPWAAPAAAKAGAFGLCDAAKLTILVRDDLPPMKAAEVLFHEILHGAWDTAALHIGGEHSSEERVVAALGYQLLQIWRDNPEVVRFLEGVFRPAAGQ